MKLLVLCTGFLPLWPQSTKPGQEQYSQHVLNHTVHTVFFLYIHFSISTLKIVSVQDSYDKVKRSITIKGK